MRRFGALVLGGLVLLTVAGCSGDSPSPSPTDDGEPSPSSMVAPVLIDVGLRGEAVSSFDCPLLSDMPDPTDPQILRPPPADEVVGSVAAIRVCWLTDKVLEGLVIRETDPGLLDSLIAELSQPSTVVEAGEPVSCDEYLDPAPVVLVSTIEGYWSVVIPRDECGHMSRDLMGLLNSTSFPTLLTGTSDLV